ncbi:futalosine hydrolase [Cohnella faecalis]|uniref:Futalosine hydrolase n=1 Tax=Cohnella faecalis TaxID=2315694 RepID=A0A398CNH1_9BACL|nr:futalosine hydrolase [Cohnella faecalis]RIE01865.1 futalosine hydrolase [Cohnella faecalis]RIE04916.1 futalosine hydrolase [Cohnella faecalis]
MLSENKTRVLIMTAVDAERDAVLRGLGERGDKFDVKSNTGLPESGDRIEFEVELAGVGPALAAARTARALARGRYSLVVSAGIGGGFVERAEVGTLVMASEIVAADLGAETPDGYLSVDELGFGASRIAVESGLAKAWADKLVEQGWTVCSGPILTVSTVTGSAETAFDRAARVVGAAAEGMEGYGVAAAAHDVGVPALEIRSVSNPVGPRDRAAWRIKDALTALEAAFSNFPEVLR